MNRIPELENKREILSVIALQLDEEYKTDHESIHTIRERYLRVRTAIADVCLCRICKSKVESIRRREYCLASLTETVLSMSYLLEGLVLESQLLPSRYGLQSMFDSDKLRIPRSFINGKGAPISLKKLIEKLTKECDDDVTRKFSIYAKLSTGYDEAIPLFQKPLFKSSAMSDGKIYCYIDTLRSLTNCPQQAAIVHVGSGGIQHSTRIHRAVFDEHGEWDMPLRYPAGKSSVVSDTGGLSRDTTTPRLKVKAMVEERADTLSFLYNVSSVAGSAVISPSSVVTASA